MSCFLCLAAGHLTKRLLQDWGAGRLLQQLWAWRKPSISLKNFRETGYFLNCWRTTVVVWIAAVNYDPVRINVSSTTLVDEAHVRSCYISFHGRMFLVIYNSHLKAAEINRTFNSAHRSAGTLFGEESSLKGSLGSNLVYLWSVLWI